MGVKFSVHSKKETAWKPHKIRVSATLNFGTAFALYIIKGKRYAQTDNFYFTNSKNKEGFL